MPPYEESEDDDKGNSLRNPKKRVKFWRESRNDARLEKGEQQEGEGRNVALV